MIAFFAVVGNMYSQSSTHGNTNIVNNTEMAIVDIQHNFMNGGSGINKGIVGTARTTVLGFMSFLGTASSTGASDVAFVDGYVKTYMTTAFTFPIGDNGKYRPAAVSASTLTNPANAAYYGISASTAITSKFSGGNEPVLPTGGPFDTTQKGPGIASVNNLEYWDINGATPAKISLTWNATSAVASLDKLTILGWDGAKWVAIPSIADTTSILGGASSLDTGSITTTSTLVPNTYSIYTLGSVCNSGTSAPTLSSTALANSCPATTADLNSLVTSSTPTGASLVWFTNNTHTGTAYASSLTAVAGSYYPFYYDSVNDCYSPAGSAVIVTITVSVGGTLANQNICTGTSASDIVLTGNVGTVVKWQKSTDITFATSTDIATTSTTLSSSTIGTVNTATYFRALVAYDSCSSAYSSTGIITIDALSVGGSIAGSTSVCPNTNSTSLTLSGIVGNVVKWQSSTSSNFSGTVTDIANTTTSLTATNLSVNTYYRAIVANGACSSAMSGTATISIMPSLGSIGEISGSTNVCGLSSATFSIAPVANATNYIWTFPSGLSVNTSAGNSVVVNVDELFREGVITVKAINACQVSVIKTITINKNPKITTINGPIATCGITTGTYVANTLTGATYNWTVPAGINITSGQGTSSIQVSYDANYVTGNIILTATNSCGVSDGVIYRVNKIQMPTVINGLAQIGTATSGTYTTPAVSGMGYIWSVPAGVTIVSGQSTNSINLSFAPTFSSGTITVAMISSCGTSTPKPLDIKRSQPILTIYGPESLCGIAQITYDTAGQLVNYSTLYATYSVPVVSDALSYTWSVPQGASIFSGQGTNSIVMGFDITTFINGNITVTTTTQFGVGTTKSLAINRVGGKIAGVTKVCDLTTTTYSVPTTIGTSFSWIVPSWMTIVSGQGTNTITVSVGAPFANDTISLNFLSNCNTNESFTLNVGCNTSTNIKDSQCGATLVTINSSIYPNPIAGAQAYKYQVTNGTNVIVFEPTTPLFNLTQLPGGVTFNTTYSIQVAVKLNGVWGGFGSPCSITTPSPITKVKSTSCGVTLATISTSIFADALVGVQGYRFQVTDPTNNVRTVDVTSSLFNLTQLIGGVAYNTTYSIRVAVNANGVWGAYGASCNVTTPAIATSKVVVHQCGTTLSALNSSIYIVAVYGAQAYRFEVSNGATVRTYDLTNTASLFNLTQLVGGAAYATTYSIRVAAKVNGVLGAYGTSCTITTPAAITKVKAQFCGTTLATLSTSIYADALIGVQGYRFEVTNGTNVRTFDATSNLFNLTQLIGGATIGTTYSIRVAVRVNGVWGAYGDKCSVTTPLPAFKQIIKVVVNEFSVKAIPNPFTDIFKLELTSINEDIVEIMVYDMLGKMITNQTVNPVNINTIELGDIYSSGVYNVIIRQGNDTKTIRMIKR